MKLSKAQQITYEKLTNEPQCSYQLKASLATLRALVRMGYAKDVTKNTLGSMWSPQTTFEFVRIEK